MPMRAEEEGVDAEEEEEDEDEVVALFELGAGRQRQSNKMLPEYLALSHVIPCCIFWSSMTGSIKLPDVPPARPH